MKTYATWFFALLSLCCFSLAEAATESVDICFNYSCKDQMPVHFSAYALNAIADKFKESNSPAAERTRIRKTLAVLYRLAGKQTPIAVDIAGNHQDESINGRMDCIDHTATTLRLLKMMAKRGWLRYHDVLDQAVQRGFFLTQHFAVAIVEKNPMFAKPSFSRPTAKQTSAPNHVHPKTEQAVTNTFTLQSTTTNPRPGQPVFIIDSWLVNHGEEPILLTWQDWKNSKEPE